MKNLGFNTVWVFELLLLSADLFGSRLWHSVQQQCPMGGLLHVRWALHAQRFCVHRQMRQDQLWRENVSD